MTLKTANYSADNALYREQNCVESMQLGRHSAGSQNWPFSFSQTDIYKDSWTDSILTS